MALQMPPVAQFSLGGSSGSPAPAAPQAKNMPPVAQFNLPSSQQTQPQTQDKAPGSGIVRGAIGALGTAGNFLFPIAGDLKDDFTGQSKKTVLQQGGDAALSALPFIPGLGEAGEAARGGGLLAKLGASSVAKGALTGYGAGVASNLSQGKGVGESLMPGVNTIAGATLGAAAPAVTKALPDLIQGASGITNGMKNDLGNVGDVGLYNKYISAAQDRAEGGVRKATPLTMAADELDKAANQVKSRREVAGQVVNEAKNTEGHLPLGNISDAFKNFTDRVKNDYGISLSVGRGGNINPVFVQGRSRTVTKATQDRLINIAQQLNSLKNGTARKASDVASNLSEMVDYSNADQFGRSHDPLEGLIKSVRHDVGDLAKDASPALAKANARFSELKDLEGEIGAMAGKNLQKGELLMRRVFSGDKSGEVGDFFDKLKNETGTDLIDHAVLAKHAIDTVGDDSQKTLLSQIIHSGGATPQGIMNQIGRFGLKKAQGYVANPETVGRRMVSGTHGAATKGILPYLTKGSARAGSGVNSLLGGQ